MTAPTEAAPPDERVRQVGLTTRLLARPEVGAIIATAVVWVFFAIVARDNNFVSWGVTASIINAAAPLGIVAIAVAVLMIAGEFDLSVGSIVGFAGMAIMIGVTSSDAGGFGLSIWLAIVLALVITVISGFFNGVLVVSTKLPSFIITLGSLFIFRGLAVALPRIRTNRTQLGGFDDVAGFEAVDAVFGSRLDLFGAKWDIAILWWVGLAVIGTWVLYRTKWGNWVFGTGGNAEAARNVGVPVQRVKITLFVVTALAAFLVALLLAVKFNGADSLRATLLEFEAIIAVVVGGTLLTGGYGSVVGPVFGALTFAMVEQGMFVTNVDADFFRVFVGAVLVLAVIFNNFIRTQAQKR